MDQFIYIAAAGARETMMAQALNSHNLANTATPGFRADLAAARSAYLSGSGVTSRAYANYQGQGIDGRPGVINATGRDLDVAVNGVGWMVVQTGDGEEVLSRRGDLRIDAYGQLINGAGQQMVGKSGPVALPAYQELNIGTDGTISIVPLGEDPNTLIEVDRLKLVNPDESLLLKGRDGLVRIQGGEPAVADAAVRLIPGSLESSNVNAVESMVRMIELARQFETHVKMIRTAEQLDQSSAELMRLS
ncbi:MAG: flagellar basal body rod protein FlgF [Porticoccaceae bacterium]